MDNIQYCQMIFKSEPDAIDPLKSCLSSFELEVKTEVEDDACNQSEIQDTKDDSKQDNSNISCDESIANVAKEVTTTKVKKIDRGRLEKIVENITKKTQSDRISKEGLKHPYSIQERSEMIVKSFLSGDNGSLTPIHYKGVVLMKEANQSHYNVKPQDLDRFKKDINGTEMYSCDDCNYTTNYFAMFKLHFMTHANMKFLTECMNLYSVVNYCFVCDFKCNDSKDLDRHMNVHRNKSMVRIYEKSMDGLEVVNLTVDSSTVPLEDASVKTENTSAGNENTQNRNVNDTEEREKLKQSEKYSTSRKRSVGETNNGVNKSKKSIVKVRERHVDESEIQPNVIESSEDSSDKKIFEIEFISAAGNSEYIHNKNKSSGNIAKDRRQASRQLKTCSKRNSVVEEINDSKKSEKESSDKEYDCGDYDDCGGGDESHYVKENTVDDFAPHETIPSCFVKTENVPSTAAAVCVKDEDRETTSDDKILINRSADHLTCSNCNFVAKVPSELHKHTCKGSNTCRLCGKICPNGYALKRHVNSHQGNVIIHLKDKRYQCGVCNVVRNRIYIKYHIHSEHCTPHKKICGLRDCINGKSVEFVCNYCSQKYMSKSDLRHHIRRKHLTSKSKESHVCQLCGKKCLTKCTYERHMKSHNCNAVICLNAKQYQCGLCNVVRNKKGIKRHIHAKHCTPDNKICGLNSCIKDIHVEFICNDCSQKFVSKYALIVHIDRKHSVGHSYGCSLCKEQFTTSVMMQQHKKNHFCSSCPFQSNSIEETTEHARTQGHALTSRIKPLLSCELCEYKTKTLKHLQWHVNKHKNLKLYACSQCDFKSKQKVNLLYHEKSHILGTTYSCMLCPFQTKKHNTLVKHKKMHGSEGEVAMIEDVSTRDSRFVYCDRCEYKTKYPTYLKTHKMKHDNICPYLCPICGATFSSSSGLLVHKKNVHLKEKKYKCSYCDYTYHTKQGILVHERKHRGEKPHQCDLCTFSTNYLGNLSAHKKKHYTASTAPS